MDLFVFRRAESNEIPRILAMRTDVFSGEQGIPADDVDTFMMKKPMCRCAEAGGRICASASARYEGTELHWGRFVVYPAMRGQHLGTRMAAASFDDIFSGGTDTICMYARDATVKIVCRMGGRVAGSPYPFFKGNVTPVVLTREDYLAAKQACGVSSLPQEAGLDSVLYRR